MANLQNHLNSLPEEITLNIFSRLSAKLVLDLKQVCRFWRNFIRVHANTTYFAYQHLERQRGNGSEAAPMSFVFFDFPQRSQIDFPERSQELNYGEYHEDDKSSDPNFITKRIKINLDFLTNVSRIVGSCNGLICLSVQTKYRHSPFEPLYICNPITREIVNLPGLSIHKKEHKEVAVRIAYGFGYHPLTNEYKVVRICYILVGPQNQYSQGQVEVYTLGSDSRWRRKGETSDKLCGTCSATNSGVWFNGAIHWLNLRYNGIVAFDLATEDFNVLPTPIDQLENLDACSLRVMNGNLSLVSEYSDDDDHQKLEFDLWVFRKNKEESNNDSTGNTKQQLFKYRSWGMEECSYRDVSQRLFALTKRGEILLLQDGVLSGYNLETGAMEPIVKSEDSEHRGRCMVPQTALGERTVKHWERFMVPVPHTDSIVSLKALGEGSVKILKESPAGEEDDILTSSESIREAKRFKSAPSTSKGQQDVCD